MTPARFSPMIICPQGQYANPETKLHTLLAYTLILSTYKNITNFERQSAVKYETRLDYAVPGTPRP
jgi:hypothetical protein